MCFFSNEMVCFQKENEGNEIIFTYALKLAVLLLLTLRLYFEVH